MKTLLLLSFFVLAAYGRVEAQGATFSSAGLSVGGASLEKSSGFTIAFNLDNNAGVNLFHNDATLGGTLILNAPVIDAGNPAVLLLSPDSTLSPSLGSLLFINTGTLTLDTGTTYTFSPSTQTGYIFVPDSSNSLEVNFEAIPEPSTWLLMAASLILVACVTRTRFARRIA